MSGRDPDETRRKIEQARRRAVSSQQTPRERLVWQMPKDRAGGD